MPKQRYNSQPGSLNLFTKAELDKMTVNVEFTLISLAQGLALAQLATASIEPIVSRQFEVWPYIIAGVVFILYFWSQAIIHALSFINWPLSLRHNFMYFLFMLIEVVLFSQITSPAHWFALNLVLAIVGWAFFYFDLGIMRRREHDFLTPQQKTYFQELVNDQLLAMRVWLPLGFAFMLTAWLLIAFFPTIFLDQSWHLALIAVNVIAGLTILTRSILDFHRHAKLICDVNPRRY